MTPREPVGTVPATSRRRPWSGAGAHRNWEAEPISEHLTRRAARQGRGHNHDGRARHYALRAVRPSPARVEAPEPDVWLPILDITGELEALDLSGELELLSLEEGRLDLERELTELEADFWRTAASGLEEAVARVDAPALREGRSAPSAPTGGPVLVAPRSLLEAQALARTTPSMVPAGAVVPAPLAAPAPALEPRVRRAEIAARRRTVRHRRRIMETALVVAVLAAFAAATPSVLAASPPQRDVTLTVDGRSAEITTRAETVGALLAEQQVALRVDDRVVPGPAAGLSAGMPIRVLRAFPVTLDVDGAISEVRTTRRSISELRRELGLAPTLRVTGGGGPLASGDAIALRSPDDVMLIVDGTTSPIADAIEIDVAALLSARGVVLGPGDTVEPASTAPLADGMTVAVHRAPPAAPAAPSTPPAPVASPAATAPRSTPPPPAPAPVVAPAPPAPTVFQTGSATWYGTGPGPGTCAHRDLAFGTIVTITYQGRTAQCRVQDRGPQAWTGHIIDLSPDVFRALAPLGTGILRGIQLSK